MDIKKLKSNRNARNRDLLRRMKQGESLALFTTEQSFFPPRPTIKKDADKIRKLYPIKPSK